MNESIDLETATERTVATEPGPIHYREIGSGPPLVFIHGLLVNGLLWRKVAPLLADGHRCIVPDLPLGGHRTPMKVDADLSPPALANVIGDILDALDLRDVTLVANDTGGALTQILATSRPERIGRLVLTSCDMFDNFLPPVFRPLQWIGSYPSALGMILQSMRSTTIRNSPLGFGWVAKRPIDKRISDLYLHSAIQSARIRHDVAKTLRAIDSRYTVEAARRLTDFNRPTLLAWAREDRVFPADHAVRMAEILPDAAVELIDDSYAFVPEDQPIRLAEAIRAFTDIG